MSDPVNKPAHYNAGEVETIDGIRAALGEGFADYCKGNVIKYVWRCGLKGDAVEDLKKAATYLQWAIEAIDGNCPVIPDSSDRKPLAIPAGWRELKPDEFPKVTDLYENEGAWRNRINDSSFLYARYEVRQIRKIETANPSEAPNSSTWVPKVGDKVRVVGLGLYGEIEYANGIGDHCWLVLCQDGSFRWLSIKGMELIEAAK
jgi:hypothetical protein